MKLPEVVGTIYEICIDEARKSPCPKRKFGAVLFADGSLVGVDHNRFIPGMEFICGWGRCVRLDIPSGTDSMIGSCGHAEEWLIYEALKEGINLEGAFIYVAGIVYDGEQAKPFLKDSPQFYCMRCAMAMLRAGLLGVYVPNTQQGWYFLTTEEAMQSAYGFASRQNEVKA